MYSSSSVETFSTSNKSFLEQYQPQDHETQENEEEKEEQVG